MSGRYNIIKKFFTKSGDGKAIKSVQTNVPKTDLQKKLRDLKIETQALKGSKAKLDQTLFEMKNKKPFTFKKDKKKSESNKERYKRVQQENAKAIKKFIAPEDFNKGGRVGLKFGSRKSNVQKIQEAFGPKKKLSPKQMKIAKLAGNPKKIDAADFAKLRRS